VREDFGGTGQAMPGLSLSQVREPSERGQVGMERGWEDSVGAPLKLREGERA
jgi:hypothetical protein